MQCDVIVVGAGVSGLATADRLGPGFESMVLEAGTRVGGRLHSVDGLDLGASWFWPGERRVASLVDELHIATHPQFLDGDAMYETPDGVVRLDGNPVDVPAWRFSRGADDLCNALRERITAHPGSSVVLDTRVRRIEATDADRRPLVVTVEQAGRDRTICADHVVLALPPALAAASIEFHPPLPHEMADLANRTPVWMGTTTKTVVRYRDAFWRDAGLSGAAVSHRGPLREIHDLSGPGGRPAALFGFSPTAARSDPVERSAVVAQLVRLFGRSAADPLAVHVADWRRETLTAPEGVDLPRDYSTFGDPRFGRPGLEGRLHWTSTETATTAPGHIEGALAAAERTVRLIRTAVHSPRHLETR